MVPAGGELRLVVDPREPAGGGDGRQGGGGRDPRRSRAFYRTTGCAHSYAGWRQRVGCGRSHGGGAGQHGRRYVARQEGLSATRTRVERRDWASEQIARRA